MDLFVLCIACLTVFCEWFGVTIRNMFGCGCYFVVECVTVDRDALLDRQGMVQRMCCGVPVISVGI